jgi:hypoxanthine phosphoribosyltransferase
MIIYNDRNFKQMMDNLYIRIQTKYDCIIGLKRGGLIPAVYLSHHLCVPMYVADVSHELSKGDNLDWHDTILPEIKPGSKILIVDDILDSGYTLLTCAKHYQKDCTVDIAVLVAKYSSTKLCQQIVPNIIFTTEIPDNAPFVYFPWERKPEVYYDSNTK